MKECRDIDRGWLERQHFDSMKWLNRNRKELELKNRPKALEKPTQNRPHNQMVSLDLRFLLISRSHLVLLESLCQFHSIRPAMSHCMFSFCSGLDVFTRAMSAIIVRSGMRKSLRKQNIKKQTVKDLLTNNNFELAVPASNMVRGGNSGLCSSDMFTAPYSNSLMLATPQLMRMMKNNNLLIRINWADQVKILHEIYEI